MKHKINYLGLLSLLALIGILGWITENNGLFGFVGFAYYLRYFWVIPDEFFRLNVQKAATFAFMGEMFGLRFRIPARAEFATALGSVLCPQRVWPPV